MTEMADRYRRRADAFEALIDGTPSERWSSPSPCEGWLARDVVAHVVDYSGQVLRERAGLSEVPVYAEFDDSAAAFRNTRKIIERVLDDPETPPKAATHVEWSLSFDLPQHGWDLAVATGQDPTISPGRSNSSGVRSTATRNRGTGSAPAGGTRRPSPRPSPGIRRWLGRPLARRVRSGSWLAARRRR